MKQPVYRLIQTWSIDFAGPMPPTAEGNRYFCVAFEHLSGWSVRIASGDQTAETALRAFRREILGMFGVRRSIVSKNGPASKARVLSSAFRRVGCAWRPVSIFTPQEIERTASMVQMVERGIFWVTFGNQESLHTTVSHVRAYHRMRKAPYVWKSPSDLMSGVAGVSTQTAFPVSRVSLADKSPRVSLDARDVHLMAIDPENSERFSPAVLVCDV